MAARPPDDRGLRRYRTTALAGAADNTWPWVHVENFVDAVLLALREPHALGRAFTIVDGHVTYGEYVRRLASWLGVEPGQREARWPYGGFRGRFATDLARQRLGYVPRFSYDDALDETRRFLEERGIAAPA